MTNFYQRVIFLSLYFSLISFVASQTNPITQNTTNTNTNTNTFSFFPKFTDLITNVKRGFVFADNTLTCKPGNGSTLKCSDNNTYIIDEQDAIGSPAFYLDLGLSIGFVAAAGIMSGLTLGLLSLDLMDLEILIKSGTDNQRKYASRIIPLIRRHHLLLVTLLLCNAAAMEALPLFLNRMVPEVFAILLSVTAVLFFGEIIPQAVCSRFGLSIGYWLAYPVWILIILTSPIAWPISMILDCMLGKSEASFYRRAELKELVSIHAKVQEEGIGLTGDEVSIIRGALDMREKTVHSVMTPLEKAFMLSLDQKLDLACRHLILEKGHSRIPVYRGNRQNVIGMIIVKNLICIDPKAEVPVSSIETFRLPTVSCKMPLYDMMKQFQAAKTHMAIVVDDVDHMTILGLITLEDVIEELIQQEIEDESDNTKDLRHQFKLAAAFRKAVGTPSPAMSMPIHMHHMPGGFGQGNTPSSFGTRNFNSYQNIPGSNQSSDLSSIHVEPGSFQRPPGRIKK